MARYTMEQIIAFLDGSGEIEGCWFGEKPPTERGNFWWRRYLAESWEARMALPTDDAEIDAIALGVARAFTVEGNPRARARMQCAVIEALKQVRSDRPIKEAEQQILAAARKPDAWKDLFWRAARALNCLPSTVPDGNEHVLRAMEDLRARALSERLYVPYLPSDEMLALLRFEETTSDDESYDVPKAMMKQLARRGCVNHTSAGRYMLTDLGRMMVDAYIPPPSVEEVHGR